MLAADTHRHTQKIKIFCLGDLPRQKLQMPFRHKLNYYREAIDCFCLRKSRRQKVRARLRVSSEQSERAANKKKVLYKSISNMLESFGADPHF